MSYEAVLLPQDLVEEAAFRLLSSSTASRYAQVVDVLSSRAIVGQLIGPDSTWVSRAVLASRTLWSRVVGAVRREPEEAELAVLLGMLATVTDSDVDRLLNGIAQYDQAPVAWLGALSRATLRRRSSNSIVTFAPSLADSMEPSNLVGSLATAGDFTHSFAPSTLDIENAAAGTSELVLKAA